MIYDIWLIEFILYQIWNAKFTYNELNYKNDIKKTCTKTYAHFDAK